MSQISLFGEFEAAPAPKQKSKAKPSSKTVANRIESAVVRKIEISPIQLEPKRSDASAKWGYCWVCGDRLAISKLDTSPYSNPALTYRSSGWVVEDQWLAFQSHREGGQANG